MDKLTYKDAFIILLIHLYVATLVIILTGGIYLYIYKGDDTGFYLLLLPVAQIALLHYMLSKLPSNYFIFGKLKPVVDKLTSWL